MVTKTEILNKLYSQNNKVVLRAIEEIRVRGWLNDGTLRSSTLCRVQLQGADLVEADLSYIDFHQAEMDFADLSNANLSGSKLTRAKLMNANLSETNLTNASLYKANLRGCQNLTDEQLRKTKSMWGAIMPDGETYNGRYNLPADLELARVRGVVINDQQKMADFYGIPLETYLSGQKEGEAAPVLGGQA